MLSEHESAVRADFARAGWSLQADLGGRLRYADAIALVESLVADPATKTGAEVAGLRYPASVADMMVIYSMGGKGAKKVGPLAGDRPGRREFRQDAEARAARQSMSPLFRGL